MRKADFSLCAVSGSDSLELTAESSALLDPSCGGALTYISDNKEVSAVNSVGRIFGKSAGTAEITATAPNEKKKTVLEFSCCITTSLTATGTTKSARR
ncbi:MAG: Ig domain-containing protein [Ruminiclostridium sp.]